MKKLLIILAATLFMSLKLQGQVTITNALVSSSTSSSATITWTTNVPATSQVLYGLNQGTYLPYATPVNGNLVTSHSATVILLTPGQIYTFAVASVSAGGQSAQSAIFNFSICTNAVVPVAGTANNYYQYGSYTLTWVPPTGATGTPTACGAPIQTTFTGKISGGGSISASVADAYAVTPGPGTWRIALTDVGNLAPISITYPVTSGSSDVSSQLQAAASTSGLTNVLANTIAGTFYPPIGGGGGSGTVTSVGVAAANGFSCTVANPTTSAVLTCTLGAITPTSTNGVSAATMAFLDATSSVQTQLNARLQNITGYITQGSGITITGNGTSGSPYTVSSSGGGGSVTNFSAAALSPLFTTSVANPGTTPALSFTLNSQSAQTFFGGAPTGSSAPTFRSFVGSGTGAPPTTPATPVVSGNVLLGDASGGIADSGHPVYAPGALNNVPASNGTGLSVSTPISTILQASTNCNTSNAYYYSPFSGTCISATAGSVTSVAATGSNGVTVSGSPITSSGTLAFSLSAVPNSALANSSTTVNGVVCTLGSTCTTSATPAGDTAINCTGTTAVPITTGTVEITLTGACTLTIASGSNTQNLFLVIIQNGTTAYTLTPPTNLRGFFTNNSNGTLTITAGKIASQEFRYLTSTTAWVAYNEINF